VSEADAYLAGKPCPKCGYVRSPADANPAWQCPRCQIAYQKFDTTRLPLASRFAATGRHLAGKAASDHSIYALIAANVAACAI
jgi:hypothetical protein